MSQIQKLSYLQFISAKIMQFRTKQLYCHLFLTTMVSLAIC